MAFGFAEELQKQLVEQVELRKKLEREFQHLKGRTKVSLVVFCESKSQRDAFCIFVWILDVRRTASYFVP